MDNSNIRMEDIYFMPYIGSRELFDMIQEFKMGRNPTIGLSARHDSLTEYIPGNNTICEVVDISTGEDESTNIALLNLYRLTVVKGEAWAVIVLNFPEHRFNIERSNEAFDKLIIDSIAWPT